MKRWITRFTLLALLAVPTAWAGFEEGLAAAQRGDYATAWSEWQPLAEQGNADAQAGLGIMYQAGHGVAKDVREAVRWYQKAANQGHAKAQARLIKLEQKAKNKNVPKISDFGTDMVSLQKYMVALDETDIGACQDMWKKKDADAAFCLALQETGEKGITMLREASKLGHPIAQNDLANHLDNDKNPADSVEIARLTRASANSGIPHAQVTLGWWHMTGKHGFTIDYSEAMQWNLKAYKQGHSEGANNAGELYEKGHGVSKDEAEAMRWYRKAADMGNAEAQFRVGMMYNEGRGVTKNEAEAIRWYQLAIRNPRLTNALKQLAQTHLEKLTANEKIVSESSSTMCEDGICKKKTTRRICADDNRCRQETTTENIKQSPSDIKESRKKMVRDSKLMEACADNDAEGCFNLAEIRLNEDRAIFNAVKMYEKSCSLGNYMACRKLGELHINGRLGNIDAGQSAYFYEKACNFGDWDACNIK